MRILKYPRTPHVQGSRLQPGDEDLEQVPLRELVGRHLVVEEKQDGANSGISIDAAGRLRPRSGSGGHRYRPERLWVYLRSSAAVNVRP